MIFKPNHSNPLQELLQSLHKQNDLLGIARNAYLTGEAQRKHKEAALIQSSPGKSHAERVTSAQASQEWFEFHKNLARLESIYEFQKLKFSIMEKEWQSQYLEMKLDGGTIKKEQ